MVQWFPIAIGRLKVTFCGKGRMGPGLFWFLKFPYWNLSAPGGSDRFGICDLNIEI